MLAGVCLRANKWPIKYGACKVRHDLQHHRQRENQFPFVLLQEHGRVGFLTLAAYILLYSFTKTTPDF